MKNMPTYEELPAQNSALKKQVKYLGNPIVLYDYEVGRSGEFAKKFLSGFSGYLHCDGWTGYDKVENAK